MTVSVANDMSIFSLVVGASLPVQLVLVVLILTSLFSWWYIFIKLAIIKRAESSAEEFEAAFWAGGDLDKLFDSLGSGLRKTQGMASIFEAGFKEYVRHKQQWKYRTSWKLPGVPCEPRITESWIT
jgi:biopolymer transport protein TolQ